MDLTSMKDIVKLHQYFFAFSQLKFRKNISL